MAIQNFEGKTFVAFVDISGFKVLMSQRDKAQKALSNFYQIGYDVLRLQNNNPVRIEGFFVSDCGILFARNNNDDFDKIMDSLSIMLNVIESISKRMLEDDLMLTTSIAFGKFSYHQRLEFDGINKDPIFGFAYLDAYLDNETGKPKLEPGRCRLLNKNFEDGIWDRIAQLEQPPFDRLKILPTDNKHSYFYWMVQNREQIDLFHKEYRDAYNLKYKGMLGALKLFQNQR